MGDFLDYSQFVTADGTELYVYPEHRWSGYMACFVCSKEPLNKRQIAKAARVAEKNRQEAVIVEELKAGTSPAQVWNDLGNSAADTGRIAKKHGITLPRNWFSNALNDKSLSRNQRKEGAAKDGSVTHRPPRIPEYGDV